MVYNRPRPEGQMTRCSVPGDTIPRFAPPDGVTSRRYGAFQMKTVPIPNDVR
jgi:hypothetical protein